MKPDAGWMLEHPARVIALGMGSGLIRPAPGTWGTLFAWLTFLPIASLVQGPLLLVAPLTAFLLGVWACDKAARDMGIADPGCIVWDEVAAFWLVLTLTPAGFGAQAVAFLLFRFFDIVKPPPIRQVDVSVKGGFGIMLDDTLAAFYALLVMALWQRVVNG